MRALFILLLLVLGLSTHAAAADLISDTAYVEDATGLLSLNEVMAQKPTHYSGVLSRGYTNSAVWLRLEITPPKGSKPDDDVVLRIRPIFLDKITLFDPLDQRNTERTVGDASPFSASEFMSLSHTFVVPAGDKPRAVWLRVKTTSTCLVHVEALSQSDMAHSELMLNLSCFAVLAIVGMFALLVLMQWVSHRDTLYALFVVRQIYYFFYTACLFGIHRLVLRDLSASELDVMYSWFVLIGTFLSLLFEYRFLHEYSPPTWVKMVLNALVCWSLTACVLMLFGETMLALRTNMLLNALGIVIVMITSVVFIDPAKAGVEKGKVLLSKRMVVAYYLSVTLVLCFSLLPYLGVMQADEFPLNAMLAYTLCSGLFMTVLMQVRLNKQKLLQAEYEKKLLLSEQEVALEKTRREEQTHLLHMLMHELKTPLSVIDMALLAKNDQQTTSSYVSRAVSTMKDILERCVKTDKLTEGSVDIHLTTVNLSTYVQSLVHEKTNMQFSAAEVCKVSTDEQFLGIMLNNLLDNAERYGDKAEPIQVKVCPKQNAAGADGVRLVVSNRPGSAAWPDPAKVFKKYYRSAGAESQSGTGLGLYLVRSLARLVGGDCRYVPDDKHIRFELWLPS